MSAVKLDRVNDLLSDRSLQGLSAEEAAELALLLKGTEDDSFDRAVAAVAVATSRSEEPLPAHLAAAIEARALATGPAAGHPASFLRVRQPRANFTRSQMFCTASFALSAAPSCQPFRWLTASLAK